MFVGCSAFHNNASLQRLLLAQSLVEAGHEIHILLQDFPENRTWINENLPSAHCLYQSERSILSLAAKRRGLIDEIRPDVVHLLGIGAKNVFTMTGRPSAPVFVPDFDELMSAKIPSLPYGLAYKWLENKAIHMGHNVVCASSLLVDHLSSIATPSHRFLYLPYAYEPNWFTKCRSKAEEIRQEFRPKKLLVYMGTLWKAYQSDQVFHLAEKMRDRTDIAFLIVGGGPDFNANKDWVARNDLTESVIMTGHVEPSEVSAYLMASDVLLFPIEDTVANRARCPNKTFQYIGANRPIVTNRVGEVAKHLGDTAYYYDFNSLDNFEAVALRALESSAEYNEKCLLEEHTWRRRAEVYMDWMQATLEQERFT